MSALENWWRGGEREERDLSKDTGFTGFVLGDFVDGVFSAVFALAVGTTGLWNVDCMSVSARSKGMREIPMAADEVDYGEDGYLIVSVTALEKP